MDGEARHLLMIPDYLHFRLAGVVSNEYTNATTSQVCGLDGQWDETLLRAAGVQRNLMQRRFRPPPSWERPA